MALVIEESVASAFGLLELHGNEDYIGEQVSQYEHAVQTALLAEQANSDEEVILAALFHDIGHLCVHAGHTAHMDGYGMVDHEGIGADYLIHLGFPGKVAELVRSHVQAKRYLVYADARYADGLSDASIRTLALQGGTMSAEEAKRFLDWPLHPQAVQLRRWDDAAKVVGMQLPPLDRYKDMARRVLQVAGQ